MYICLFLPVFLSGYLCIYLYLYVSVLEADILADLAGGSGAGLGQEKPPVGANANLVDSLPSPRGRGAGGGLPLRQPHQANPSGIQRDLGWKERKLVRLEDGVKRAHVIQTERGGRNRRGR